MSRRKTVRNEGMAVAIVVMYSLLGAVVAGSCMWRLLSSIACLSCSLDLSFERVTDAPDGTAAAHTHTRHHAAAIHNDTYNDFR
jgi:hypothetical protein